MEGTKEELERVVKTAKVIAAIDVVLSGICAANGSLYFVWFMLLAGLMWAYGTYVQSKVDEKQGE